MALKDFSVSSRWWDLTIWGGGHTPQTDPIRQGWRASHAGKDPSTVLAGRRGQPCCFSARPYRGDQVDVGFYYETPEEVSSSWSKGEHVDAHYKQFPLVPGWGLQCLEEIGRMEASECAESLEDKIQVRKEMGLEEGG